MSQGALDGVLFDGRTAAATPVRVSVGDGLLRVATPSGDPLHEVRLEQLRISDPFASAPRQVRFDGGVVVEVADGAALTALLAAAGRRAGLVDRLQQRWPAAVGSLVASVAILAGGYFYGLPAMARLGAAIMPARLERKLGDGVMELLDAGYFRPTELPELVRGPVERRVVEAARRGAPGLEFRLVFRATGQKPGVNAFALPGGTVVILDGLVERTDGDDRLVAVVGHELGHLSRHHPTQALLKAGGIGAVTSLLWGDISSLAANVPAILAMLGYSRDAEREADDDAIRFLRAAGRTARPMFDAFCLLAEAEREKGMAGVPRLLSSHPDLAERLEHVREVAEASWACVPSKAGAAGAGDDGGEAETTRTTSDGVDHADHDSRRTSRGK